MIRREFGPIRVGAEVCLEAKADEEYGNRDAVCEFVSVWHMCVRM